MRRQGNEIRNYKVYGPKMFVLIGDVYDSLRDRSILINLRRAHAPERFLYPEANSEGAALRPTLKGRSRIGSGISRGLFRAADYSHHLERRFSAVWYLQQYPNNLTSTPNRGIEHRRY
jgi:hypothetical protein